MADKTAPKPAAAASKGAGTKLDLASIAGLVVALGGIIGGLLLEGGKMADLAQFTAGMIVLGGTIGAVMLTTPMPVLLSAAKRLTMVFFEKKLSSAQIMEEIISYAAKARKNSIVSLEPDLDKIA